MAIRQGILSTLVLLTLAACGDAQPTLPVLEPGDTVLAFGDSLTFGYGANPQQSYPALLQDLAVLDVVNAGISGEVSQNGLQRLPALLQQHHPSLVILCHGGNDLLRSTGTAQAKQNILQMINLIEASGAAVVLLGVPQPGLFISTAEFYDEIASETAVSYIPDLMQSVLRDASLKSDAAHPNAAGYEMIASEIYGHLMAAGAL